jgi:ribosomal protein S12 methylthiotransferase
MGCSKNRVDSEHLGKQLDAAGFEILYDASLNDAYVVIINTCGFIDASKKESIDVILRCIEAKNKNLITNLFVMGCMSEIHAEELKQELPEVDKYFGTKDIEKIVRHFDSDYRQELRNQRIISTHSHYAYLKIAEGCNRTCAFCTIPNIRGQHVSTPIEDLLEEATSLAEKGVKELLIISQDINYYGLDLYKKQMLGTLIDKLCQISGVEWLRLHYAYPNNFPLELLDLMLERQNICRYLDIPIQHISDKVLKNMRRNITGTETIKLIETIRKKVPNIALRTTLIVGHPGEDDKDFDELLEFVKFARFDRLGVFTYSHQENTYASKHYTDSIPEKVKQERYNYIMKTQQEICRKMNEEKRGKVFKVLIDSVLNKHYIGRTEYDSPEVDMQVFIPQKNNDLKVGNFYDVKITDAQEYDLYGMPHYNA